MSPLRGFEACHHGPLDSFIFVRPRFLSDSCSCGEHRLEQLSFIITPAIIEAIIIEIYHTPHGEKRVKKVSFFSTVYISRAIFTSLFLSLADGPSSVS